jgi:hypothetical protein
MDMDIAPYDIKDIVSDEDVVMGVLHVRRRHGGQRHVGVSGTWV